MLTIDQCKILDISDQELINQYLLKTNYPGSRNNFLNLYMYQDWTVVVYTVIDDILLLFYLLDDGIYSLKPLCDKKDLIIAYSYVDEIFENSNLPKLYTTYDEELADYLASTRENLIKKAYREYGDYLYDLEKFKTFSGKKLQKKRNHLNAFYKLYDYQFVEITNQNVELVKAFLKTWHSDDTDDFIEQEIIANNRALDSIEELDVYSGCIIIDNKVQGFIIGSRQGANTLQINIEKANDSYRGIYQALLKELVIKHGEDFTYLNREEDMGIETLRKSKLAYHPCKILLSYRICAEELHELLNW
ncbi:MAG: DUF2156 domain-containing protein [Erysipelotrichaceae bacterium]